MKRSKRLEPVGEVLNEAERELAIGVAAAQGRLLDAEKRCGDLQRYLNEYQEQFQRRAKVGMGVTGMRDYQAFIARLGEAVRQQQNLIAQLRIDCEQERERWLEAAARKSAIGKVIAKARSEDKKIEDRQMQKEMDERAQRLGGAR